MKAPPPSERWRRYSYLGKLAMAEQGFVQLSTDRAFPTELRNLAGDLHSATTSLERQLRTYLNVKETKL